MDILTIEDVVDSFSDDLPKYQQEVNLAWLTNMHGLMREGAVWGSPNLGTIYQKKGDGFVLLDQL